MAKSPPHENGSRLILVKKGANHEYGTEDREISFTRGVFCRRSDEYLNIIPELRPEPYVVAENSVFYDLPYFLSMVRKSVPVYLELLLCSADHRDDRLVVNISDYYCRRSVGFHNLQVAGLSDWRLATRCTLAANWCSLFDEHPPLHIRDLAEGMDLVEIYEFVRQGTKASAQRYMENTIPTIANRLRSIKKRPAPDPGPLNELFRRIVCSE